MVLWSPLFLASAEQLQTLSPRSWVCSETTDAGVSDDLSGEGTKRENNKTPKKAPLVGNEFSGGTLAAADAAGPEHLSNF